MKISDYSIQNPVKVAVGVILVAVFGLIALFQIPVQLTPEVMQPVVSVQTRWSGASPHEMEKEIISPQEEMLQDIEGLTHFSSSCGDGYGYVEMEFKVGTDLNSTLLKVSNRLQQVREYPEDADEPVIETAASEGNSIAYFSVMPAPPTHEQLRTFRQTHPDLAGQIDPLIDSEEIDVVRVYGLAEKHSAVRELIEDDPDVATMRTFVEDEIADRIAQVPGVSLVEVYGGSERQLRVTVDPVKLAAMKITVRQLRDALTRESADVSGGDIWEGKRRYVIRTLGRFADPEQVKEVIVTYRDGAPVYVKDIGKVELSNSKTEGLGRQRGVNMLTVSVQRQDGANVLEVMAGVKAKVADMNATFLKAHNLFLFQTYDETVYITSATRLVRQNIFVGGSLAILVLWLFLRNGRTTMVVALAIPICCVGTFLVVRGLGRSINVISLAGMAFAVGMVVDSAIVVLENIYSHYQRGESPLIAASRGTSEVWGAVLASTLTTLAVFLPVISIQEEAGQLFRDIAIAISAGVSLSLVVSLTVIPAASSRLLRRQKSTSRQPTPQASGLFAKLSRKTVEVIVAITRMLQTGNIPRSLMAVVIAVFALGALGLVPTEYEAAQSWPYWIPHPDMTWLIAAGVATVLFVPFAFKAKRAAVALTMIVFALGASYKLMLPAEYLPEGNKNLVRAMLQPPPGYNIEQMIDVGKVVESRLRPMWEAEPGSPEAEALDGPALASFFTVARRSSIFMGSRTHDPERAHEMVSVLRKATSGIPGISAFVSQTSLFDRRRSGGRLIEIEITGPELERLVEIGADVMQQVQELYPPETDTSIQAQPSLELAATELHITRNLEKAAERGVSTVELGYALNALVDGAYAGTFWHEGKEIDLVIYGDDRYSAHTQDVSKIPIGTPGGELITIGDVADVEMSAGPETLSRINRQRAVTLMVRPGIEIALEDAMRTIEAEILQPLRDSGELAGLYRLDLAGTADKLLQMRSALGGSMLLALLITFLLIAALYESFLYPLAIMISVPMAAVGGFAGLRLLNVFITQRLDTLTMLGFIILVGTVVNNAILIVNQALNYIRDQGLDHNDAVEKSVQGRIRPIFMSTATTVLGMLPLVLFPGAGSELYRGLGSVVLGGLLVSTFFTLFLVPMLFTLMYEFKLKLTGAEQSLSAELPASESLLSPGPALLATSPVGGNGNGNGNGHPPVPEVETQPTA